MSSQGFGPCPDAVSFGDCDHSLSAANRPFGTPPTRGGLGLWKCPIDPRVVVAKIGIFFRSGAPYIA